MIKSLAFAFAALWLVPLASAQDQKAAKDDSFAVKLEKEPEGAKAVDVVFFAEKKGAGAAEKKYKGYKHGSLDGYEKVAARKKIYDEGWDQKCQKEPACAKAIEGGKPDSASQGKAKEGAKESVKKLAKKIAFIKAAKKALKAKAAEAKGKADTAGEAKCQAAEKLLDEDHAKAADEAKKKNETFKMKIFDLEAEGQQP